MVVVVVSVGGCEIVHFTQRKRNGNGKEERKKKIHIQTIVGLVQYKNIHEMIWLLLLQFLFIFFWLRIQTIDGATFDCTECEIVFLTRKIIF